MLEMVFLSSMVMGIVTYLFNVHLLNSGINHGSAQNLVLLLAILFSTIMIGNARSMKRYWEYLQFPLGSMENVCSIGLSSNGNL